MKSGLLNLIAMSLIVLGASASTACAHGPHGVGVRTSGAPSWWRDAYNRGYQDGGRSAERDARRGRGANWHDRRWDHRDERRRAYEEGYRDGYRASFARYDRSGRDYGYRDPYGRVGVGPRYPGSPRSYRSPAFSRGYEDGYKDGRDAGEDRDRYDPLREKKYRKGDSGYEREYGSKDAYRAEYRNGFRAGYSAGYREHR